MTTLQESRAPQLPCDAVLAEWAQRDLDGALGLIADVHQLVPDNVFHFIVRTINLLRPQLQTKHRDNALHKICLSALQLGRGWLPLIGALNRIISDKEGNPLCDDVGKVLLGIMKEHTIHFDAESRELLDTGPFGDMLRKENLLLEKDAMVAKSGMERPKSGPKCILVVTIRDDEIAALKQVMLMHDLQYDHKNAVYVGHFQGKNSDIDLVLGQIRDTGNIVSAIDTGFFINKCKELFQRNPYYAILTGICAGNRNRNGLRLGDVVIPQHVFDTSINMIEAVGDITKKSPEIRVPGAPDPRLIMLCRGIKNNDPWQNVIKEPRPPALEGNLEVHLDPLFTGNDFLADQGKFLKLCSDNINRKGVAYEMEAGGFAGQCQSQGIPYIVVRGVSDYADSDAPDDRFRPYAASTAAAFVASVVIQAIIPG